MGRPKKNMEHHVIYNGHKRKHALKFQIVVASDGIVLHAAGPCAGIRQDWMIYLESGIDEKLPVVLKIFGTLFCIYGDSGYSQRHFMEIPFEGSQLTDGKRDFTKAM